MQLTSTTDPLLWSRRSGSRLAAASTLHKMSRLTSRSYLHFLKSKGEHQARLCVKSIPISYALQKARDVCLP